MIDNFFTFEPEPEPVDTLSIEEPFVCDLDKAKSIATLPIFDVKCASVGNVVYEIYKSRRLDVFRILTEPYQRKGEWYVIALDSMDMITELGSPFEDCIFYKTDLNTKVPHYER